MEVIFGAAVATKVLRAREIAVGKAGRSWVVPQLPVGGSLSSGQAFAPLDVLLDEARGGPLADLVVEAIPYNSQILAHSVLHPFAVKRANAMLAQAGSPFWQEENYDREVLHREQS